MNKKIKVEIVKTEVKEINPDKTYLMILPEGTPLEQYINMAEHLKDNKICKNIIIMNCGSVDLYEVND